MESIPEVLEQVKLLVGKNQKAAALALLEKALQQWPDRPVLMLWYAGLTPDLERGIQMLERVLQLEPDNAAARKGLEDLRRKREATSLRADASQPSAASETAAPPAPGPTAASLSAQSTPEEKAVHVAEASSSKLDLVTIAGKTLWPFRNLKGSIQELVEANKVTSKDLLWAAQNAQQEHLRWAAAVYLRREHLHQMRLTPTDLDKIIWPFRGINRPIVQAIQAGQVTLNDLIYAILNARDIRLLQGAALAGYRLLNGNLSSESSPQSKPEASSTAPSAHPTPPSAKAPNSTASPGKVASSQSARERQERVPRPTPNGELRVIEGSPYLRERRNELKRKAELTRKIGIGLVLSSLLISIMTVIFLPDLCALPWLILSMAYGIAKIRERFREQEENLIKGIEGEEAFVAELRKHLDSDWVLFRNIDLPDRSGDIDAVLVGPKGIYLFEIKAYDFVCRNQEDQWEYQAWGKWKPISKNPTQQALRNAARLNEHLKEFLGQYAWVEPRIVWAGKSKLYLDKPRVKIWYLGQQEYWLKEIQNGKPLPPEKLSQIVASLRTLCAVNRSGM